MYSIIETGGFQFKAKVGDTLAVPYRESSEIGSELEINSVLLFSGKETQIGTPTVAGAVVKAEVLSHGKDDKIIVFKKKRRQGYRNTKGHRQRFTELLITEVSSGSEVDKVDSGFASRVRARVAALAKQKEQGVPLTRKEKILKAAQAKGEN
jgi:large subunit ribosomal protein L21